MSGDFGSYVKLDSQNKQKKTGFDRAEGGLESRN